MNRVLEIEQALRQMPPQERREVARWLLEDMQTDGISQVEETSDRLLPVTPDYSARRRRILGDKVVPNMVLAARAEESW